MIASRLYLLLIFTYAAQALSAHLNSADVAEELLNAVGALCLGSLANTLAFSKSEVCGLVERALVRHEKVDSVVEAGLFALMHLIETRSEGDQGILHCSF